MVDDVAGGQLAVNILQADALLDHEHHDVIDQIGDLVDGLGAVVCLGRDDGTSYVVA